MKEPAYKRVLLKMSGEALAGEKHTGFDEQVTRRVGEQVLRLTKQGHSVGIVIGGGNFWRGRTGNEIDRDKSDQIGMLATVMNCIYVSEIFRTLGMRTATVGRPPLVVSGIRLLFSKMIVMGPGQ